MTRTDEVATDLRNLPAGTLVVSKLDGEPGRIIRSSSHNRSGTKATAYLVQTDDGREVWETADIVLPNND